MAVTRAARTVGAGAIGGYACLQWLGRTYGSTRRERRASMPGDDLVRCPQTVATHAVTLPSPPEQVWPWLAQVGWHRGGWYTARWVDALLFPANAPSAGRILTEYQHLEVGDFVPDGPPETECGFVVREVEPGAHLVLQSSSHLPLLWRTRGLAGISWTWAFVLTPVETPSGPGTRLVFRWRARTAPWWLTAGASAFLVPADFLMSRDMLRGLRRRVAGRQYGPGGAAPGQSEPGRLQDLDDDECRALLSRHRFGRIAWNDREQGPFVLPISYTFDGEHVLVRTSPHTELARHFAPGRVAFEIDHYDERTHTGWSVLVHGLARVAEWDQLPSPAESPTPVVGGARNFHIRIAVERMTGRRVLPARDPSSSATRRTR